MLVTRGTDITMLQGGVADIKGPIDAIVSLICAGAEIPQRILMGSERGELASTQDKDEFWGRVSDRRADFCNPIIATALVTRLIEIGALPEPKSFDVRWPDASKLDDSQLAAMATQWASLNSTTGKTVVTIGEIRELIGLPPLEEVDPQAADANEQLAQAKLDLALAMPAQVGQSGSPASKPPDKKKQAPPEKTSKLTAAEFFKLPKPVRKFLVLSGEGRKAYMDRKMAVGE
jgi:hypothetical protein